MGISYPIFVKAIDDKHVILIDSLDKINYLLEPIDVENNEYIAWDREGFPLEIKVDKQRGIIFEKLDKSNEFEKLRESIIDYAKIYGVFNSVKELFEKEIDLTTTLKYLPPIGWRDRHMCQLFTSGSSAQRCALPQALNVMLKL